MNELETIRRAYRYVVAYERRILDVMARVDEVVRGAGFVRNTPHRWYPLYRAFPSRDWPTERWAWDNVPLYTARFTWIAGEPNTAGTRYVLVDHVADTAFEEKRLLDRSEPEPLEGLPSAEDARTVLRWHVIEITTPIAQAVWRMHWHDLLAKHFGVPTATVLPTRASEPARRELGGLALTSACVDLTTIDDPAAIDAQFIEPLRAALEQTRARNDELMEGR